MNWYGISLLDYFILKKVLYRSKLLHRNAIIWLTVPVTAVVHLWNAVPVAAGVEVVAAVPAVVVPAAVAVPVFCSTLLGVKKFNLISKLYSKLIKFPFFISGVGGSCWDLNLSRSQSHVTESTEQSAPVAFDLTNRVRKLFNFVDGIRLEFIVHFQAKLPRGIEEIRPHIENVDNVPLLVSLFTESTPTATREMVKSTVEIQRVHY